MRRMPWLGLLAAAFLAHAEEHALHTFKKITLSDKFYGEGANFGDFNADGKKDIVSGPYWHEGPDFKKRHEYYPAKAFDKHVYSENFFAWARDFNKDGYDDILIGGFPGKECYWHENPKGADGAWKKHMVVPILDNESPAFVDITGDGEPELVFSQKGRYSYASPDSADPTKPWIINVISTPGDYQRFTHGLGVGDVNGDGRPDLLEKDGWWEQPPTGDASAWKKHPFPFSRAGGSQMFAYDFDGDGDNDVLTSLAAHAFGLNWYENEKKGDVITFKPHRIIGDKPDQNRYGVTFSQLHAVDLVDVDKDGIKDIVTGKRHWAHGPKGDPESDKPAVLYWFKTVRGPDGVDFIPYKIDDNSGVGTQVVTGDVNGDGWVDVIVGNKMGTFVFIHEVKKVSKEEWEKAQPKPEREKVLSTIGAEEPVKPAAEGASKGTPKGAGFFAVIGRKIAESAIDPASDRSKGTIPLGADGKPLNLGFESGTLVDWLPQGEAFEGQPIKGDVVHRRRADMKSAHAGDHWVGTFERGGDGPRGTLVSKPFRATQPFASFLISGGSHRETRVEIVRQDTGAVIARAFGDNTENLAPFVVDLTEHQGKPIFIRVVDEHSGGWGHINFDDFRLHASRPAITPRSVAGPLDSYAHAGLSPTDAAAKMTLLPGFRAQLFAGEPDVKQPIAMTIDDRGRLWIAEAYAYPVRAPEAEARDRILIFEDADGDGRFDTSKVFAEKLNLVSGIEKGFGGLFVGAAPHLLFIPDMNNDDKPDGPPQVLLDGWGLEDTHETLNSFIWGPDGWLYGCHGVFTHSKVGRPGAPESERQRLNAGIWRYQPVSKKFEVFAHGTSNPWGVDFNDRGQCFLTCCVIPHLFHVIQGARYHRQSGPHFDPFTYDDIKTIAKHRHWLGPQPHAGNNRSAAAGGGHAHAGAMLYLGAAWPAEFRDRLFMNNIHGARINQDKLEPKGSGYVGDRSPDLLEANDKWSQILYLRYGPDGQVFMIDWYDASQCHLPVAAMHDRRNGRIFKISAGETQKVVGLDLAKETDEQLVKRQLEPNDFYVRQARRLLQERAASRPIDAAALDELKNLSTTHSDDTRRLRALWCLHVTGNLDESLAVSMLKDESPYLRGWLIQLMLEDGAVGSEALAALKKLAASDPSPVVRLYLTSAVPRLKKPDQWEVLEGLLAHAEDAQDHNLPLMYWYAIEPLVTADPARALGLAKRSGIAQLLGFVVRRIGQIGTPASLDQLVRALGDAKDEPSRQAFLEGIQLALQGRRRVPMPPSWSTVAAKLQGDARADIRAQAEALAVTFGDPAVMTKMAKVVEDTSASGDARLAALRSLLTARPKDLAPTLQRLLDEPTLRRDAIRGLELYDDEKTAPAILAIYSSLPLSEKRDALATLSSRPAYATKLLAAVREKNVPATDLSADLVRQLRNLNVKEINDTIADLWGVVRDSPADKAKLIAEYQRMLSSKPRVRPDAHLGRAVFAKTCAQCHKLFGTGGAVGPELTGSNRANLDYVLSNVLDSSAVMAKEYMPTIFATADGRVVTGIIKDETASAYTVATATETVILPKSEVETSRLSDKSMMPDDLWKPLSEHEVRSLVAYLAAPEQVAVLANADNVKTFFNGKDLTGWTGNAALWKVEDGEIVGTSPGIKNNEFLKSDLMVGDFSLRLKVKLVPNGGNSGVQFRSSPIENGLVKGYQADIGAGWWGKLYEEHGREMLWNKSGEQYLRKEDWNDYRIVAIGSRIRTYLNGHLCVDLDDPPGAKRGIIALQIHSGPAMEVRFRDLVLELDPKPEVARSE